MRRERPRSRLALEGVLGAQWHAALRPKHQLKLVHLVIPNCKHWSGAKG